VERRELVVLQPQQSLRYDRPEVHRALWRTARHEQEYRRDPRDWTRLERPNKALLDQWLAKTKEVIDGYQPELLVLKALTNFDSDLRNRIRLCHHISRTSLEETAAYIDHGLEVVHRKEKLFSDAAMMEIFKRTNGIARQVNRICYNAIVAGTIEQRNLIDSTDLPPDEP
jgi:hypothetical protein